MNQNLETSTFENNCNIVFKKEWESGNAHLYHTTLDKKNPVGYEETNLKYVFIPPRTQYQKDESLSLIITNHQ